MDSKICKTCNIVKNILEFNFMYKSKNIRVASCKNCLKIKRDKPENKEKAKERWKKYYSNSEIIEKRKKYKKEYRSKPKVIEHIKKYQSKPEIMKRDSENRKKNRSKPEVKEHIKEWTKEYISKPEVKERSKECSKKYRSKPENKERLKELSKKYRLKPEAKNRRKEWLKEYRSKPEVKIYEKEYRNIPENKLKRNINSRISRILKNQKSKSLSNYLGCSYNFFLKWLEYQLYDGMTMNNYGTVWHVDHTKPASCFNLLNENDLKKCYNWINLRPLLKHKNLTKSNKIDIYAEILQEIKAKGFLAENVNKIC